MNYVCPVPQELDLPERVYKYRAVNKYLFQSLRLNQVWLAKPSDFNDPFEPERQFQGSAGSAKFTQSLARDIHDAGVLCLCKSCDNLPMWSYYGDGLRGVAIAYDLRSLLESMEPVDPPKNECVTRWKYVFDLSYRDDGPQVVNDLALLINDEVKEQQRRIMFATKSRAYEHEQECRIVVQPSPDQHEDYAWVGHGLYQHSPEAIVGIVFGELTPEQDRRAITKMVEGRNVAFKVATRNQKRFALDVRELPSP